MKIRAVVAEDHALARIRLIDLLRHFEDIELVGQAQDGNAALTLINETKPDLVFLDIQMPGTSGVEVLRQSRPRPLAIFTTAHDQHAVTAFELHALDYLLKPFGLERLLQAVDRARTTLHAGKDASQLERATPALDTTGPLERVFVRQRGQIIPVVLSTVEHLEARGDYVRLWQETQPFLLRTALSAFCARLNADQFFKIHRSHAINIDHVTAFSSYDAARLQVQLRSGKTLVASRPLSVKLRERLTL